MNTTTHSVAPEEVMAYLDGELSASEAAGLAKHLEECAECADLVEQLRGTSQAVAAWSVAEVSEGLDEAVSRAAAKAALSAKTAKPSGLIRGGIWNWKLWSAGGGGAVAAALVVVAFLIVSNYSRRRSLVYEQSDLSASTADTGAAGVAGTQAQGMAQTVTDQKSKVAETKDGPLESQGAVAGMEGNVAPPQPAPPLNGRNFSSLVTIAPGIAADSNGQFHGLGDHIADSISVDGQAGKAQLQQAPGPMIARTVSLIILVKDFAASRPALDAILARHRGYSAQLNVSTPENAPRSLQASLRIPAPELMAAAGDLKTLGRVENEAQSGEEVTQEHTDLVARLKTARETEQRFESILEQRTGNVGEVLQVEEGIARVRGEIESMETELTGLEHRVDFATVDLQITEEYKAQLDSSAHSTSTRLHNAFVAGVDNAGETLLGIVLFFEEYGLATLIWLAILGLPVFLVVRRYRKLRAKF
jgi:hypothetical protein